MYQETISDILVFKTNILHDEDVEKLALIFSDDARIKKWNIDRNDIDHVLRIESEELDIHEAIALVQHAGFFCEELPD
jgi:hypothetical protein